MVMLVFQIHAYAGVFVFLSGLYLICTLGRAGFHKSIGKIHLTAVLLLASSGLGAVFLPGFSEAMTKSTLRTVTGEHVTTGDSAFLALVFISFVSVHFSGSGARIWIRLKHSTDRIRAFALDYLLTLLMCIAVGAGGSFMIIMLMRGEYQHAFDTFSMIAIPMISIGFDIYTFIARPKRDAINWRLVHSFKMMWTVSICFSALWLRLQVQLPEILHTDWPAYCFYAVAGAAVLISEKLRHLNKKALLASKLHPPTPQVR